MKRIVFLGQPGICGDSWCRCAAERLARRLDLPFVAAPHADDTIRQADGWITAVAVDGFGNELLRVADTAIWLDYSPMAVTRAWLRGVRARLADKSRMRQGPGLSAVAESLRHMASKPGLHRMLHDRTLAHLQVFHLRNPDETDFWLRAQEHRGLSRQPALAQAA